MYKLMDKWSKMGTPTFAAMVRTRKSKLNPTTMNYSCYKPASTHPCYICNSRRGTRELDNILLSTYSQPKLPPLTKKLVVAGTYLYVLDHDIFVYKDGLLYNALLSHGYIISKYMYKPVLYEITYNTTPLLQLRYLLDVVDIFGIILTYLDPYTICSVRKTNVRMRQLVSKYVSPSMLLTKMMAPCPTQGRLEILLSRIPPYSVVRAAYINYPVGALHIFRTMVVTNRSIATKVVEPALCALINIEQRVLHIPIGYLNLWKDIDYPSKAAVTKYALNTLTRETALIFLKEWEHPIYAIAYMERNVINIVVRQ